MAGYVCKRHFEATRNLPRVTCPHREGNWMCTDCNELWWEPRRLLDAEEDACPDCKAVRDEQRVRTQLEDTIDPTQPWGQHIYLTCKNHPKLRWHTKNITCIGARTIFFAGEDGTECNCSGRDLIVVPVTPKK